MAVVSNFPHDSFSYKIEAIIDIFGGKNVDISSISTKSLSVIIEGI
jgi:hypothetical protein